MRADKQPNCEYLPTYLYLSTALAEHIEVLLKFKAVLGYNIDSSRIYNEIVGRYFVFFGEFSYFFPEIAL